MIDRPVQNASNYVMLWRGSMSQNYSSDALRGIYFFITKEYTLSEPVINS